MTDLDDLRATTYQTIVTLHRVNGLPMPRQNRAVRTDFADDIGGGYGMCLDLWFDTSADVDKWAGHLGFPEAADTQGFGATHTTHLTDFARPVWLGWHSVHLQALLPNPAGVAVAVLTPDDPRLPQETP